MRRIIISLTAIFVLYGMTAIENNAKMIDELYYSNYENQIQQQNNPKLSEIENALYGHTYAEQELLARIERLENTIYNRYYPNYPLEQRLNNLIYNYNRRNHIARTNKIKRIVNSINSAFVGVPTGYTPPISDPYYNGYGSGSYYYGNNGWGYRNSGIGTGSGVRILY